VLRDVTDQVMRADDVDGRDAGAHAFLAGECCDGVDLARCEPDVGEAGLGAVREVGEAGDVVGDVLLAAGGAVAVDRDLVPVVHVDDEDAGAVDDAGGRVDRMSAAARGSRNQAKVVA
jgi:hypothetical protein